MSERIFNLNGYIPMPISGPCFVTPLFTSHSNLPWLQKIAPNDKILEFSQLNSDSDEWIISTNCNQSRNIGDEAIYGFRLREDKVLFETRTNLKAPLLEIAQTLEERPHTKKAIENFTKISTTNEKANPDRIAVVWDTDFRDNNTVMAVLFTLIYHNVTPVVSSAPFSHQVGHLNLILDEADDSNGLICLLSNKPKNNLSFEIGLYLGTQNNSRITKSPPLIFVRNPDVIQNDLYDTINRVHVKTQVVDPIGAIISTRDYLTDNFNMKPKGIRDIVNKFNKLTEGESITTFRRNPNLTINRIRSKLEVKGAP